MVGNPLPTSLARGIPITDVSWKRLALNGPQIRSLGVMARPAETTPGSSRDSSRPSPQAPIALVASAAGTRPAGVPIGVGCSQAVRRRRALSAPSPPGGVTVVH